MKLIMHVPHVHSHGSHGSHEGTQRCQVTSLGTRQRRCRYLPRYLGILLKVDSSRGAAKFVFLSPNTTSASTGFGSQPLCYPPIIIKQVNIDLGEN